MDENTRNLILAAVLSFAVLIAWQTFYGAPKLREQQERQRIAQQQQKIQQQQQQAAGQPQSHVPQPGSSAPVSPPVAVGTPAPAVGVPGAVAPPAPVPGTAGSNRDALLKASPRIAIETSSLTGSLSLKGGRIDDVVLRKYRNTVELDSGNVVLFSPRGAPNPYFAEHGWVGAAGSTAKLPTGDTVWQVESSGKLTPSTPVRLVWDNGEGLIFRRTISIDDQFLFTISQTVENKTAAAVTLYSYGLIARTNTPQLEGFFILHEGLIGVVGEDGQQEVDYDDILESKQINYDNLNGGWLGITDKYWASAVIPDQTQPFRGGFSGKPTATGNRFQADFLGAPVTIAAGATGAAQSLLFAGAKEVNVIDGYGEKNNIKQFDLMIDWGWLYFLTKPLFFALDYLYRLLGNFGLAILGVTVIIKLILFPLANKSYVSMSRMKKLQPEMMKIKERYGDDRTRQQQEMMKLYQKEKVNPASGCLPILVQIPVFFALYKVLFVTIEMRHAPFYGWIQDLSAPDPTSLFNGFGLWPLPFDLPLWATIGIWPLIMGVTMFIQMKLNPAPPDPVQAKIFTWMPVFFTFLLAPFPAGLVIYWAWNNLLSVIQQSFIMHRQGVEITLFENLGIKKPSNQDNKT